MAFYRNRLPEMKYDSKLAGQRVIIDSGKPIEDAMVYHIATQILLMVMVLPPLLKGKRNITGGYYAYHAVADYQKRQHPLLMNSPTVCAWRYRQKCAIDHPTVCYPLIAQIQSGSCEAQANQMP